MAQPHRSSPISRLVRRVGRLQKDTTFLSQAFIRFQLPLFWLTTSQSSAINNLPSVAAATAGGIEPRVSRWRESLPRVSRWTQGSGSIFRAIHDAESSAS